MEKRQIGTSGLRVSVLGLGCNNFGGRTDKAGSVEVIHRALDRVSPLSVSVMLEIGREKVYGEGADEILAEAEAQLLEEALG